MHQHEPRRPVQRRDQPHHEEKTALRGFEDLHWKPNKVVHDEQQPQHLARLDEVSLSCGRQAVDASLSSKGYIQIQKLIYIYHEPYLHIGLAWGCGSRVKMSSTLLVRFPKKWIHPHQSSHTSVNIDPNLSKSHILYASQPEMGLDVWYPLWRHYSSSFFVCAIHLRPSAPRMRFAWVSLDWRPVGWRNAKIPSQVLGYPPATSFFRVEGRWKAKIHRCLDHLDGFRMDFWMENGSDDSDGVLCIHILGGVIAVIITIIMIMIDIYIYTLHYITLHYI